METIRYIPWPSPPISTALVFWVMQGPFSFLVYVNSKSGDNQVLWPLITSHVPPISPGFLGNARPLPSSSLRQHQEWRQSGIVAFNHLPSPSHLYLVSWVMQGPSPLLVYVNTKSGDNQVLWPSITSHLFPGFLGNARPLPASSLHQHQEWRQSGTYRGLHLPSLPPWFPG